MEQQYNINNLLANEASIPAPTENAQQSLDERSIFLTSAIEFECHKNPEDLIEGEKDFIECEEENNCTHEIVQAGFENTQLKKKSDESNVVTSGNELDDQECENDPDYCIEIEKQFMDSDEVNNNCSRKRKRNAGKSDSIDEKNKRHRELGKDYIGWRRPKNSKGERGVQRSKRQLGPPCTSQKCKTSHVRYCNSFPESQRLKLFNNFWFNMSWDQKKVYVLSHVKEVPVKRKTQPDNSRRSFTKLYFLPIGDETLQVCQKYFLGTFGLKETMIRNWLSKGLDGMHISKDIMIEQNKILRVIAKPVNEQKEDLVKFLDSLPKLPSHYCRQSTDKLYVEY